MSSAKPNVLFLDDFENAFANTASITALAPRGNLLFNTKPLRGQVLTQALASADGVVLMRDRTPFGAKELDQAPNLKFVIYTGTRNNLLDSAACEARAIPVFNTEFGPSKASTCELTWALILGALKRLEPGVAVMRNANSDWRANLHYPNLSDILEGETMGLIGLGNIGARVAKVAQAFGMKTLAWSPNMTAERAQAAGATHVPLDQLLAQSKVVSLHMVLAPTTRNMIDAKALAKMRSDAVIVNTSRSALINEADLIAALRQGRPAMAALDVFDTEPLPADHPFRTMPNVLMTPHMGFVANPVYATFTETVAQHLDRLLPR
jgi:phosphoglycerate dehydrogenase-like enzyme